MNFWAFVFILVMDSLRAGPDATPPNNMLRAIIFNGSMFAGTSALMVLGLRAKQSRRALDVEMFIEAKEINEEMPAAAAAQQTIDVQVTK